MARGLAAVAIGLIAVAAALIGAGRLLAVSIEARSDVRSVAGLAAPLDRLPWTGPLAGGTVTPPPAVSSGSRAAEFPFKNPVLDPLGSLALIIPDADITGSLGAYSPKLAVLDVEALRTPLPRARPQLASLAPPGNAGIEAEEDARLVRTAVYDITARTVYLPSGERLEAHSGLGDLMDDPRHVRQRNRGATPPNTYELTLRESLFHGVQAIRLTPVNEDDMFGRDGILAHPYMLGPNGQSNGCVSFKDYPKFLRAFLRGEIDRIVVVGRLPKPPVFARRSSRSAAAKL